MTGVYRPPFFWQTPPSQRPALRTLTSGGTTVTATFSTDADSYYSVTLSTSYTFAAAFYTDADSLFAPRVDLGLTAGFRTDADAYYAPTITTSYTATAAFWTDGDTYYAPIVTTSYTVTAAFYTDADVNYSATVVPGTATITAGFRTDGDTLYAGTVSVASALVLPLTLDFVNDTWTNGNNATGPLSDFVGAIATDSDYGGPARLAVGDLQTLLLGGTPLTFVASVSSLPNNFIDLVYLFNTPSFSSYTDLVFFADTYPNQLVYGTAAEGDILQRTLINRIHKVAWNLDTTFALSYDGGTATTGSQTVGTFNKAVIVGGSSATLDIPVLTKLEILTLQSSANLPALSNVVLFDFYTDADALYSPTVSSLYTATAGFRTDADAYYAPTLSTSYTVTAAFRTDADTLYAATVVPGAVNLTASFYTDADAFYSGSIVQGLLIPVGFYGDGDSYYSGTVTTGAVSITAGFYAEADNLFAPTVVPGTVTLTAGFLSDGDAVYSATTSTSYTATAGFYSDADASYLSTIVPGAVSIGASFYTDGDGLIAANIDTDYSITVDFFYLDADALYSATAAIEGTTYSASANLTGSATIDGNGIKIGNASASLTCSGTISGETTRLRGVSAALVGSATMAVGTTIMVFGPSAQLRGVAVVQANVPSEYEILVTDPRVKLVYTAEIFPWAVSDRIAA